MISAFGLAVEFALPVPELERSPPVPEPVHAPGPALRVELATPRALDRRWTGSTEPELIRRAVVDGLPWVAERGRAGDLRMQHALGRFHLDPAATRLGCAPRDAEDPAWRRLLLDTALVTASLARGRDALHAGCVVRNDAAIAIAGASGAGKTTLLLELLRAGARFLADDVVALEAAEDGVLALPGPPLANFPAGVAADELAEQLHRLDDEWWVRIRDPDTSPRPLRTVLVLEAAEPGADAPPVRRLGETAAPLLAHALYSGSAPRRLEQRFALLARLASGADVLGVRVDKARPPRALVERLIEAVPLLQA